MAVREVVQIGDEILRKKSEQITDFGGELSALLDDMKETLEKEQGAGLAAVQIGVLKRVFVVNVEEGYFEFVNPRITKTAGTQCAAEGCLSVKGKYGDVERPNKVVVKAFDRSGKRFSVTAYGFFARAICHEYDHLDGVLYIDKATNIRDDAQ